MKKLVLVLALVAVYGFAISNVSAKVITSEKSKVTVVVDSEDDTVKNDATKKGTKKAVVTSKSKKATATGCCASKETKTSCPESAKKSCAAAKKSCGAEKKVEAKKPCCAGK